MRRIHGQKCVDRGYPLTTPSLGAPPLNQGGALLNFHPSFKSPAEAEFNSEHAILVADSEHGDFIADIPFELDDAVLGVGSVRDVGEGEVVSNLLFHGHQGAAAEETRHSHVGIDFNPAHAEQMLDA